MERLTGRRPDGTAYLRHMTGVNEAIDRLAAYEDTGLEPEEISRRVESLEMALEVAVARNDALNRAEQEGRLVALLPCKVGDTVYRIEHDEGGEPYIAKDLCIGFRLGLSGDLLIVMSGDRWYDVGRLGKIIFLTREAAEAALAEMERGSDHA